MRERGASCLSDIFFSLSVSLTLPSADGRYTDLRKIKFAKRREFPRPFRLRGTSARVPPSSRILSRERCFTSAAEGWNRRRRELSRRGRRPRPPLRHPIVSTNYICVRCAIILHNSCGREKVHFFSVCNFRLEVFRREPKYVPRAAPASNFRQVSSYEDRRRGRVKENSSPALLLLLPLETESDGSITGAFSTRRCVLRTCRYRSPSRVSNARVTAMINQNFSASWCARHRLEIGCVSSALLAGRSFKSI